jgi:hypothetical protein
MTQCSEQALIVPGERAALKLTWMQSDDWAEYFLTHMATIRAKYFPSRPPVKKVDSVPLGIETLFKMKITSLQRRPAWKPHCSSDRMSATHNS